MPETPYENKPVEPLDEAMTDDFQNDAPVLNSVHEWLASEVPGMALAEAVDIEALLDSAVTFEDKAEVMPVSEPPARRSHMSRARRWIQPLAAAALLIFGFGLGRLSGASKTDSGNHFAYIFQAATVPGSNPLRDLPGLNSGVIPGVAGTHGAISTPVSPAVVNQNLQNKLPETPAIVPSAEQTVQTNPQQPRATRHLDSSGRLVIETALSSGGGQATWVIDGGFKLNEPDREQTSEIEQNDAQ